jgi:radical SAM superfamily enzyme YgiQ (UPF0313 family)
MSDPVLTDAATSGTRDRVHLIYPPLASSSFGKYYPSTAVLAAFLAEAGIAAAQEDLNQRFAEYLLTQDVLDLLIAGGLCAPDSHEAAAARWARTHRDLLVDPATGFLRSAAYLDYPQVLKSVAAPIAVDPGPAVLQALGEPGADAPHAPMVSIYRDFYHRNGIRDRVAGAALVGISVPMGPQLVAALVLAAEVKAADPEVRVVLGGPVFSLMALPDLEILLAHHRAVDAVVRFDGEFPLLALARQALAGEWNPGSVPGTSARDADAITHLPPGAGPHLDRLPYPQYAPSVLERLTSPTLAITQARGCYWGKCDYCDFVELFDGSPPFRGRHPDAFVAELEHLVNAYGAYHFTFVTESIPPAFARRMSQLIIDRGLKVAWTSFAMVDRRFDRELLQLMGRSGCERLIIGMETMVTRVLKTVHKSADREENIRFLREASAAGVELRVNLIPDLPTTTYDEALASLADIRDNAEFIDGVAVFPFEPTRSSNVGRNPGRFGLLPLAGGEDTGIFRYALNHLQSYDPAMTAAQRAEVHRRYKDFAIWINSGGSRHGAAVLAHDGGSAVVRVPVEDMDIIHVNGRTVCSNVRTSRRFEVPAQLAERILPYLDGRPIDLDGAAVRDLDVLMCLATGRMLTEASPAAVG